MQTEAFTTDTERHSKLSTNLNRKTNNSRGGTSLEAQWLGLRTSNAGGGDSSLVGERRSYMPFGTAKKKIIIIKF